MSRIPDDPYGDFSVRVMNACRIARRNMGGMSDDEFRIVQTVFNTMKELDPASPQILRAHIIIRPHENQEVGL